MNQDNKPKVGTAVIVAALVALLAGGVAGYAVGMNKDSHGHEVAHVSEASTSETPTATPAADLRVALNAALREHVSLAAVALRDAFDGAPTTEAALASLDENSVEIAGLVGSVYGDEAEATFLSVWRDHIGFFADYTLAAKAGDQAAMAQAKDDLNGYTKQASAFFADANEHLPKDAVNSLLQMHVGHVIAAVDAYGAGDYKKSFAVEAEAYDGAGQIADTLAAAIAKQNPDKF